MTTANDAFNGKSILGYTDRLSVAPGDELRFMVHSGETYEASIVRITGDPPRGNTDGVRQWHTNADWAQTVAGTYPAQPQETDAGSYGRVDAPLLVGTAGFTLQLVVFATTPALGRPQYLLGQWSAEESLGAALLLDEQGCISLITGNGEKTDVLSTGTPITARRHMLVTASFDARTGRARLRQTGLDETPARQDTAETTCRMVPAGRDTPFMIAATMGVSTTGKALSQHHFNGKLEAPRVLQRPVSDAEAERLLADPQPDVWKHDLVAAWDFSLDIDSSAITDLSPHRHDGALVNLPTRAMTGWRWDAREYCWQHAPEHYGAIHFHEDDLYDAGWTPAFSLTIPADAPSGIYAARLATATDVDYVPFFLRAPTDDHADILLLMPTASYLAYGNEHLGVDVGETEPLAGHLAVLQKGDIHLAMHRELGLSLYDRHADGSGVCYSSPLRPLLNMRPGKSSSWIGRAQRAPWQFNADLDLVDYLEHEGYRYDVATDEDLHREGLGLLAKYRVVMTGSHPEYYSTAMMEAVQGYLDRGGRLMYMGGNGFYWRIAYSDAFPGAIELRRAEDGIRDWTCEPGEYYHSFTGELGGLWRRIGRSPQSLVGIGMATQGFDYSGYFRRQPGADDPRASFVFAGIKDDIIGDFGDVCGGAAGLELDRVDADLGSPAHVLTLASSEGHSNLTFAVPEEVDNVSDELVATRNDTLRGDIVFFETPCGGAVFSTGSIAWAGSLAHNGYDNNVARMTSNTLDRFLDGEPFPWPGA